MRDTNVKIICDGEMINKHSDGGRYYGWNNPIEILPPIGSLIEYMTFNQNHKEDQGVMSIYKVKGYFFTTEEYFNNSYCNKVCEITVDKVL